MSKKYVMAFDSSTTGACAIVFDDKGGPIASVQEEITQHYPHPGWVEHDPEEIWERQLRVGRQVIEKAGLTAGDISAIGITNQRETAVLWDRETGKPVHRAIVWQDRRTAEFCDRIRPQIEEYVAENTGLVVDAYFSASKVHWILENVESVRERAERGELAFGTIDSWLIWKLTGGRVHVTDVTNASRTLVFNIREKKWDDHLLSAFGIPAALLPQVKETSDFYGNAPAELFGAEIPLCAVVGDQQAALFGQVCYTRGSAKCSYGTSAALLMNTGDQFVMPGNGLVTTLAASVGGDVQYAVEGVIFNSGSAIQWLRDELRLIQSTKDAVVTTGDTNGVYFVPAFTGMLAPVWDPYARGTIVGLTRGANREHLIRATLEALAFQVHDMAGAVEKVTGLPLQEIRADGGGSTNDFVMQFQADISNVPILRPFVTESASRGAAFLAGLASGVWESREALEDSFGLERRFEPAMARDTAEKHYAEWLRAVDRALGWARPQTTG